MLFKVLNVSYDDVHDEVKTNDNSNNNKILLKRVAAEQELTKLIS